MRFLVVHALSLGRVGLLLPWALAVAGIAGLAEMLVARATRPESSADGARAAASAPVRRIDPQDDDRLDHLAYSMVAPRRIQGGDHVLCVAGDRIPVDCTVVAGAAFTDLGALSPGADAPGGVYVRSGYVVLRAGAVPPTGGEAAPLRSRATSAGASTSNAAAPNATRVTSADRRRSQPPAPLSPVRRESSSA